MEALPCARSAVKLEEGISGFKESFQDSFFLCQLGLSEVGIEGHLRKKEKKILKDGTVYTSWTSNIGTMGSGISCVSGKGISCVSGKLFFLMVRWPFVFYLDRSTS